MLLLPSANFFSKLTFSKKFFQEHHQSVKQLGSDQEFFEKKMIMKKISKRQQSMKSFPGGKELNLHAQLHVSSGAMSDMQAGKALARLCICADSSMFFLVA